MENDQTPSVNPPISPTRLRYVAKFLPILVLLLLVGAGLWYFKSKYLKPQTKTAPQTVEPEKITNEAKASFSSQGSKNIGGVANIFEINGKSTEILLLLEPPIDKTASSSASNFFVGIYSGKCGSFGEKKYTLTNITNWGSSTVLPVTFEFLKQLEPIVIDVREDEKNAQSSISCGKITYR